MADLRDLDADRRFVDQVTRRLTPEMDILICIADSALDEIEQLKRLLVLPYWDGKWETRLPTDNHLYPTEADAWAAVRKAAMGK